MELKLCYQQWSIILIHYTGIYWLYIPAWLESSCQFTSLSHLGFPDNIIFYNLLQNSNNHRILVKVLLLVGTKFSCYRGKWSVDSWNRGFDNSRHTNKWNSFFSSETNFVVYQTQWNPRKLVPYE